MANRFTGEKREGERERKEERVKGNGGKEKRDNLTNCFKLSLRMISIDILFCFCKTKQGERMKRLKIIEIILLSLGKQTWPPATKK